MVSNYAPKMSTEDYRYCLAKADAATNPEQVQRLRTAVLRRWGGDPMADALAELLYARQVRLTAYEHVRRLAVSSIATRRHSRR